MTTRDHIVVIGASIAGLLAARVASDHAQRVTIIERDTLTDTDHVRAGVPQSRHVHGLLVRGLAILRDLFPGLDDDLDAAGVPRVEWMRQTVQRIPTGWTPRYASSLETRPVHRAALEAILRRRVRAIPNITFRTGVQVRDLIAQGSRVHGVRIEPRRPSAAPPIDIPADLVIDCSGRGSHMPEWLRALGFDAPRVEVVNAHLAYASRVYAMPADFRPDWRALLMLPAPENPRGGVLTEIERGQWMLTVAGTGGDVPPTDDAGFAAFIDRIGAQPLCDALRHAQPLTPIYGYRRTESRRQRYDALRRMPHGVIVMGDAVAAFNPVYGQGMTAAALGARLLGRALAAPARRGFEITFQRRLARAVFPLWLMAVTEDARYRTTEGVRWRGVYMLLNRYNDWLFQRLPSSPTLAQSFLRVLHVVDAPLALLHPRVIMARLHRR